MSLYQKYRPQSFEDMIGSAEQIASLQSFMQNPNRPHVYLFTGGPGCGKTTAARICAKTLGASEIAIREINSANNRGIDTARTIAEEMRFMPIDGNSVVYIMDECHQWSKDMSNTMLKPLEDTPKHVYFFLCTTDPGKMLKALKTRCTEVQFSPMSERELSQLLRKVAKEEGIEIDKELLLNIAEHAEGSARKALVLLEKVASVEDEEQRVRIVEGGFTEEESAETIELCRALLKEKCSWSEVAGIIKNMNITEPETVRHAVLGYMNSVLLSGKQNNRAAVVMEFFAEPTYNTGKMGITLARIVTGKQIGRAHV